MNIEVSISARGVSNLGILILGIKPPLQLSDLYPMSTEDFFLEGSLASSAAIIHSSSFTTLNRLSSISSTCSLILDATDFSRLPNGSTWLGPTINLSNS